MSVAGDDGARELTSNVASPRPFGARQVTRPRYPEAILTVSPLKVPLTILSSMFDPLPVRETE